MRLMPSLLLLACATLLAEDVFAQAVVYCCDDASGKKLCGDYLPAACRGRAYEERDSKGFVSKLVEAPLTEEQQAKREAERLRKIEADKQAAEDRRRAMALLSAYSSDKDIDKARDREIADIQNIMCMEFFF